MYLFAFRESLVKKLGNLCFSPRDKSSAKPSNVKRSAQLQSPKRGEQDESDKAHEGDSGAPIEKFRVGKKCSGIQSLLKSIQHFRGPGIRANLDSSDVML